MLPKPDLMPLTGGYRRTPVLQIGADIFCDTAVIARELERRIPAPSLYPPGTRGVATMLAAWADRVLFLDVVGVVFGTHCDSVAADFKADRFAMSEGMIDAERYKADLPHLKEQLASRLWWLEHALDGKPFLLGDAPSLADFAAFGPIWMLRARVADLKPTAPYAQIEAWCARIEALGLGTSTELTAAEALAVARDAEPAPVKFAHPQFAPGLAAGDTVEVLPDDYARDPVAGTLVGMDSQRVVIRREDAQVGTVHVHFPRVNFRIRRA
jgi:glutathione S-transferase